MNMGGDTSQQRDPHAYSNGLQRGSGPYAVDGPGLHLADEMNFGGFRMNRLEQLYQDGADATVYDIQAWFGNSYDQLVVKAEGDFSDDRLEESDTDILWSHAIYSFWNTQVGVRHQSGEGPDRNWLAFGVQGIAPYWFEVDATAYLGSGGRSSLNIEADYELLITQRLVLQPRVEANFYGEDDRARGLGSGLSDSSVGLRLKYQINRQLVPYIGVEQARMYGDTAKFSVGPKSASQTRWLAGLRFWF
ncbi:MAG: copper resistance protein B [Rhizobiaceae bacterium]|nr:copper resistance protein B [Rhizobiaceae bacterium]